MSKTVLPVVTTPTRVELGARCYRRHALEDVLERGLTKNGAAAFGTVMHAATGAWWQALDVDAANAALDAAWREHVVGAQLAGKELSFDLAQGMLAHYIQYASLAGPYTAAGPWQTVMLESRLEIPLGKHRLSFQADRVLSAGNRILLLDLKTASRFDARWEATWLKSLQFKLYKTGMRQAFGTPNVDVVIEGLLKKVPSAMRYVSTPDWTDSQLDEAVSAFDYVASQDAQLIRSAQLADGTIDFDTLAEHVLTNASFNYNDCYSYGGECQFHRLCTEEPELRLGVLKSDYHEIVQEY